MPINLRHIEPGGSLEVMVMTGGAHTNYSAHGMKTINLEVSVDDPAEMVFDSATVSYRSSCTTSFSHCCSDSSGAEWVDLNLANGLSWDKPLD